MNQDTSILEIKSKNETNVTKRSFFSNLEIVVTSRCNIKCRHCIYDCQFSSKEKLSKPIIKDLIRQAAKLPSLRSVIFTGGEAFLEYENLVESIALCEELELESSIVTNGYWALNPHITKQKLKRLNGLKILNVSTDSFHQEFVPLDRIRNIIKACNELGIECVVRVSYLNDPAYEIGIIKEQLIKLEGLYTISAMPVAPFGRAAELMDKFLFYEYNLYGIPCCGADNPVIDVNGDVKFCPGGLFSHPDNSLLTVGNIFYETLEALKISTNFNPIVQMLRLRGPSGLVHLVRNQAIKEKMSFNLPQVEKIKDLCSLCKYIITDPYNAQLLQRAVKDPDVYREIALTRFKEFGEISMLFRDRYTLTAENADIIEDTV
jgi:MoaA/NifB/PqqE/SkfB family radical SAM enzyme